MKINKIIIFLIVFFLNNCAAIPGNNVKLSNYAETEPGQIKNLDLSYKFVSFSTYKKNKNSEHFNYKIAKYLNKIPNSINKKDTKCLIEFSSQNEVQSYIGAGYQAIATATLYILPYYMPYNYQAHATLISTRDNRILKEYEFKDKVHEIWSLPWALSWFIYEPKFVKTPEFSKESTEEKLSEALVRSVLNDASKFDECKK